MKIIGNILAAGSLMLSLNVTAQTSNTYKFDFGNGKPAPGYIQIKADTKYGTESTFGFDLNSTVESVDRGGKDPLAGDLITSDKPFYFSVNLPEGNYDVKVLLGDTKGTSATTVRAESRRLFVENVRTDKGKTVWKTFTVHIKDTMIRDANGNITGRVKIKDRERSYLHWDNKLTLEFNDSLPKVCAVEIVPNTAATTVFLAGNSTVVDQDREPWAAWGQMIPAFFEPSKVCIANYAESGEALYSFKGANRLQKILSLMKPGDYLFIEFGHNDQKRKGEGIGPFTSYKSDMKYFITEAKKKGGIPVVVTSMNRRNFDSAGHINNTLGDYPEAARQAAKEEGAASIDLNAMSKVMYETWGVEASLQAFVYQFKDNTHFSPYGAYEIARCIAAGIAANQLSIAKYLKPSRKQFDPSKPDALANFYWPKSVMVDNRKPDGN